MFFKYVLFESKIVEGKPNFSEFGQRGLKDIIYQR
jgi:hypothetical protein